MGGEAVVSAQNTTISVTGLHDSQNNVLSQIYPFTHWIETGKEREGKDRLAVQNNILI